MIGKGYWLKDQLREDRRSLASDAGKRDALSALI